MGYKLNTFHKDISYVLIKNKKNGEKGVDYFVLDLFIEGCKLAPKETDNIILLVIVIRNFVYK